jgi:peptidoglycan/xylan/chitin deacetylase (PgdA/CDA1 family)
MATKRNKPAQQARKKGPSKARLISGVLAVIVVSFVLYKAFFSLSSATYVTSAFRQSSPLVELCPNAQETLDNTTIHEFPLISASQQKRLAAISTQSDNLVENPTFRIDPATKAPAGFNHNDDSSRSSHDRIEESGEVFLRAANGTKVPAGEAGAGWVMSPISILPNASYRYAITYRSSVPVIITLDSITGDGSHRYNDVERLPASSNWSTYYAILDNSSLKAAQVRIIASSREKGTVDIQNYTVQAVPSAQLAEGMVSLTFDDGWKSIYTKALPILRDYGYQTSQYIISDVVSHDIPAYMNKAEVTAMQKAGHEIGSHSLQHCDMGQLSVPNLHYFADTSYKTLSDNWGTVTSFAYPFGSYNKESQSIFSTRYQYIRTTDGGYNDRYFDREYIRAYTIHQDMPLSEIKQMITTAKDEKKWVIFVYHGIDTSSSYDVSSEQLRQHLDVIKESGIRVERLTDAADSIKAAN